MADGICVARAGSRAPAAGGGGGGPGGRFLSRGIDCCTARRLAHERRQPLQPTLFAADRIDRSNVAPAQGRVAHAPERLGSGPAVLGRSAAARPRRRDLRHHRRERRVRARCRQRRDPLAVPANLDPNNHAVCCGWTNRGVGLGDGKVFVGQLDGKLVALDQRTGEVVWSIQAERWQEGFSITSAPLYLRRPGDHGLRGGERGVRGRVKAYDADDGKLVLDVLHDSGARRARARHVAAGQRLPGSTAARPVWQTPAVDPELGLVYFSTGNPAPISTAPCAPATTCSPSSIVAVEAKTGKYRWHFQQVHHDIWDYDAPNPVVLFDATHRRRVRKGSRRSARRAGSTSSIARPASRSSASRSGPCRRSRARRRRRRSRSRAATRSCRSRSTSRPRGLSELVNDGRIFTPFLDERPDREARPRGGANWPPSSYDPESQPALRLRLGPSPGDFTGGAAEQPSRPVGASYFGGSVGAAAAAPRHLRGGRRAHQQARLAPALAEHVLQRLARDAPAASCSSAATTAG